ncbi:Pilus assembly protein, PilO [Oceanobacillus limi]|uniref:Pilus assembly protein, PilO n=1 Tax=Oceanobacillus limi TaxID=930131 RepID=A0A1I0EJ04_9BACI|nr:type 4a pilus biogenesis protein PilO [Oceanobacillus limi]SET44944.1 Pilus assembly protein, PilO [Oceanobacillus limi]
MAKRKRINTVIWLGLIVSALVFYGICFITVIHPLEDQLHSTEQQVTMFETRYDALVSQTEDIDEDLSYVALQIPNRKSPDNVLSTFHTAASNANVVIESISSIGEVMEEESAQVRNTSYSIEVSGDKLINVNLFLGSLLESERLITIDSISVNQREDSVSLSLTVTTYFSER